MAPRSASWRRSISLVSMLGIALLLGARAASAGTVEGQVCMQTLFGANLNCTANDVSVAKATSVEPDTCIKGQDFDLTATFEVRTTATQRYDIGLYFATDGDPNKNGAKTGECSLSTLPTTGVGAEDYEGDFCGDTSSANSPRFVTVEFSNVACEDTDDDGFLNLPNCVSWRNNAGDLCEEELDAFPGTKSKCKCDPNFEIPVKVEPSQALNVSKEATPNEVPETGANVHYVVTVTNPYTTLTVTIDSIVDSPYGNLADPNNPLITNNQSCVDLIGVVLDKSAPGNSETCEFDVFTSGNKGDVITDVVTVCGTDSASPPRQICGNATATVRVTDVVVTPSLAKTAQSVSAVQVDVTYQAIVTNSSATDSVNVNSLEDDKFGDIIQGGHPNLVSPCVLSQNPIPPGDNATCTFVGRITSTGTHTNVLTGDATDSDGESFDETSTPPLRDNAKVEVTIELNPNPQP